MKEEKAAEIQRNQILEKIKRQQEERQDLRNSLMESRETNENAKNQIADVCIEEMQDSFVIQREDLYNEIWQIGLTRTAKKYGVSYAVLKQVCQDTNIPLPTQSYWGNIAVGKSVEKTVLPKSDSETVSITKHPCKKSGKIKPLPIKQEKRVTQQVESCIDATPAPTKKTENVQELKKDFVHKKNRWGGPLYERETLYQEVWRYPVVDVAQTYGVSDVMIHKICKKLNIPTPPPGYWAKKRAGQALTMIPLPKESEHTVYPFNGIPQTDDNGQPLTDVDQFEDYTARERNTGDGLDFLSSDEYEKLILTANSICVTESKHKLHPVLQNHKKIFSDWSKQYTRDETSAWPKRWQDPEDEPAFWASVSQKGLPRVYSLLDALYRAVESMGGAVRKELELEIRGEVVPFEITEGQTKVPHVLTTKEQREMDRYEKEKLRSSWVSEPKIRKYDYISNGILTIRVRPSEYYRDSQNKLLEMRLGEILLDLYRESETVRIKRKEREAEQRRKEEEARQRELHRQRKIQEIARFKALENEAEDYEKACKLRAYIAAVESDSTLSAEKEEWIAWAKAKADWLDPLVSAADPFFGRRQHDKDEEYKQPKIGFWD